jgi:hypothetical protein
MVARTRRRALIVATAPDPADELRDRVAARLGDDVELYVVAPTSDLSVLEWLASDEDRKRREAERRAEAAADGAPGRLAYVGPGDPDPLQAIEDALRVFPADEIVLVTRPGEAMTWLEEDALHPLLERFGLPIVHIVDDDVSPGEAQERAKHVPPVVKEIARGESPATPFLAQQVVFVVVAGVALVLIGIAVAVYYGTR